MKRIIFSIVSLILLLPHPISASELSVKADQAYMNDDFQSAIELYQQSISEDGVSSIIFYNLGNAFYRTGNLAQAIIAYERALKIDPNNNDVRLNLEFVNSKIIDKPVDNETMTEKIGNKIVNAMNADAWAWTTFCIFLILILAIAGYIFTNSVPIRKICFFGGIIFIVLLIGGIISSLNAAKRLTDSSKAIVTSESVQLGTSPRPPKDKSEQAFLLHEGTKLTIVDSLTVDSEKWYEVKVDSEHRAWINNNDIEKI